jgi:hypothetical protein
MEVQIPFSKCVRICGNWLYYEGRFGKRLLGHCFSELMMMMNYSMNKLRDYWTSGNSGNSTLEMLVLLAIARSAGRMSRFVHSSGHVNEFDMFQNSTTFDSRDSIVRFQARVSTCIKGLRAEQLNILTVSIVDIHCD